MLNIETLRNEYLKAIPEKLYHIKVLWSRIIESRKVDENFIILHRSIHNLVGCCKIYGLDVVTSLCAKIEHELSTAIQTEKINEESFNKLSLMIKDLLSQLEKISARRQHG